jgi:hypothetical protein
MITLCFGAAGKIQGREDEKLASAESDTRHHPQLRNSAKKVGLDEAELTRSPRPWGKSISAGQPLTRESQ